MDPKEIAKLITEDSDIVLEMLRPETTDAELYLSLSNQINKISNSIYKSNSIDKNDLIDLGILINKIPWGGGPASFPDFMGQKTEQELRQDIVDYIKRIYKSQDEDLYEFSQALRRFFISIMIDET